MVVRITSGSNPRGAVYYNEDKIEKGEADRLALRNYVGNLVDPEKMERQQVAYLLEEQAARNERVNKPTFHVSLSLAPGEKPDADELLSLADKYMAGMGYGRQPYAVYQHRDTEHTHIHIVSIRVDENGKRVLDKFEREKSNKLRQQLEKEFGLVEAEKVVRRQTMPDLKPVHYSQGDLKEAITSVVLTVLNDFRFSSFSQYNQLLNLYNVQAVEVPLEGKKPGMVYTVAKEQEREGIAFKSSSLRQQPTRETVERRIKSGKKVKDDAVPRLRIILETRLADSKSWVDFQERLHKMNILVLPHQGKDDNLFGVSFLDAKSKMLYSGSELGKSLSAGSLKKKLGDEFTALPKEDIKQKPEPPAQAVSVQQEASKEQLQADLDTSTFKRLLYAVGQGDDQQESEQELKKMTRKRRPRL